MKFLKILARSALFCSVLSVTVLAQPGKTCALDYNPFEIRELGYVYGNLGLIAHYSSETFEERINSQHIFVGKVVSQDSTNFFKIDGFGEDYFASVKVNVIKEIAGKLKKNNINIGYTAACWQAFGTPEIGGEYIFFANAVNKNTFDGLVSSKWTAALNGIPKDEIDPIIKEIQDYRNGVKRPVVVGYLIKHKLNPYFEYVNKSFNDGTLWRGQDFKNDWRIKKWGYLPEYAEPLKGVKVVVQNLEGVEIASTKTDSSGRFEFAELPPGGYQLTPDVPKSYLIVGKCGLNDLQKGGVGLRVAEGERVCDRTLHLDVAPAGELAAEVQLEQGNWKDSTVPDIYLVGANSKTGEIYQNSLFKIPFVANEGLGKKISFTSEQVIAGEYILRIGTSLGSPIYYPGVREIKKAKIIKISEGETKKINFSISTLKDK
jgi:hypothetical protein